METALRYLAFTQAVYFIATGVWPILHIRSFMAVTGPKSDLWLVKAVGALVTVIGGVIAYAAWRGELTTPIALLAVGSAAALTAVDVIYVFKRVIARIYLIDALAEVILIVAWLIFWPGRAG